MTYHDMVDLMVQYCPVYRLIAHCSPHAVIPSDIHSWLMSHWLCALHRQLQSQPSQTCARAQRHSAADVTRGIPFPLTAGSTWFVFTLGDPWKCITAHSISATVSNKEMPHYRAYVMIGSYTVGWRSIYFSTAIAGRLPLGHGGSPQYWVSHVDGEETFCFFHTADTGNRTPNSGVKGSGAYHYPMAPARVYNRP